MISTILCIRTRLECRYASRREVLVRYDINGNNSGRGCPAQGSKTFLVQRSSSVNIIPGRPVTQSVCLSSKLDLAKDPAEAGHDVRRFFGRHHGGDECGRSSRCGSSCRRTTSNRPDFAHGSPGGNPIAPQYGDAVPAHLVDQLRLAQPTQLDCRAPMASGWTTAWRRTP